MPTLDEEARDTVRRELEIVEREVRDLAELFDLKNVAQALPDQRPLDESVQHADDDEPRMIDLIERAAFAAQFIDMQSGGWIRRKLENHLRRKLSRIIRRLVRLVRRHSSLSNCVPKVTLAVKKFRARRFRDAVDATFEAFLCIHQRI